MQEVCEEAVKDRGHNIAPPLAGGDGSSELVDEDPAEVPEVLHRGVVGGENIGVVSEEEIGEDIN